MLASPRFAQLVVLMLGAVIMQGQIRVIAFGAHPDDCDIRAAGSVALWTKMGAKVKFVSITNGDVGHQTMHGEELARRRLGEAKESARRQGIEYDVLDNHDGRLLPTLDVRDQVIREIRGWKADVVLAPRPNDYHPDHRYTGVLVQDAAYMVVVPHLLPDVPALRKNPVFLYYEDGFQRPNPFRPDIVVAIDDVIDKKIAALDSHVSQFYEWLPWVDGRLEEVPADAAGRRQWLREVWTKVPCGNVRSALARRYGAERGRDVQHAEAFELCEYGRRPSVAELDEIFPR